MARGESKPSICWDCARACGLDEVQCSWFGKEKTLPEGCEYEEKQIWPGTERRKDNPDAYTTVYAVQKCPQFLEETAEIKAKLRGYRMAKHEQPAAAVGFYRLMLSKK